MTEEFVYDDNEMDATDGCILIVCYVVFVVLLGVCAGLFTLWAAGG